jgi:23S rRNA pseudouridine2605 synthase
MLKLQPVKMQKNPFGYSRQLIVNLQAAFQKTDRKVINAAMERKNKTGKLIVKKRETSGSGIRLNRFIASSGVCSRREADELILKGLISVNGKVVKELGCRVGSNDVIKLRNRKTIAREKSVHPDEQAQRRCNHHFRSPCGKDRDGSDWR